jgi:hypothetical protein
MALGLREQLFAVSAANTLRWRRWS